MSRREPARLHESLYLVCKNPSLDPFAMDVLCTLPNGALNPNTDIFQPQRRAPRAKGVYSLTGSLRLPKSRALVAPGSRGGPHVQNKFCKTTSIIAAQNTSIRATTCSGAFRLAAFRRPPDTKLLKMDRRPTPARSLIIPLDGPPVLRPRPCLPN